MLTSRGTVPANCVPGDYQNRVAKEIVAAAAQHSATGVVRRMLWVLVAPCTVPSCARRSTGPCVGHPCFAAVVAIRP